MSKRESVVFQVNKLMREAYYIGFGRSRHSDKRNAMARGIQYDSYTKDKIYSQNTYKNTNKTCIAFVKFCREKYGIKYISEIKPNMFDRLIERGDYKTSKSYNSKTAATYFSQMKKLENIYNTMNNTNIEFCNKNYKKFIIVEDKRKIQMPRWIHDKIIERCYKTKRENGLAFSMARAAGLRISEITNLRKKDFQLNKNRDLESITIFRSKGGKTRVIEAKYFSVRQIDVINSVYKHFEKITEYGERFFKNKSESYSEAFRRTRDFVTGGNEQYKFCGVHSLRKEFANDFFDRETNENGRDEMEVKQELVEILGHNRMEVLKDYLR